MKHPTIRRCTKSAVEKPVSEILILPDGKIFAHNITPEMAQVLAKLDPADEAMNRRALRKNTLKHEFPN
jgi:hypothetical protein